MDHYINKPTPAFIAASWSALIIGISAYGIGLFNATMPLYEKGYYLVLLFYGLFSAISLQKVIRDRLEQVPVTQIYLGLCWGSVAICLLLIAIGLFNAALQLSEKGFYIMSFLMGLFGAITVQKNIRDLDYLRRNPDHNVITPPWRNHEKQIDSSDD